MNCAVEGCGGNVFARQWCQKHYARWLRHGDPTTSLRLMDLTVVERIERQIAVVAGGCWVWTGRLDRQGYARAHDETGHDVLVHRWNYQRLVGAIPEHLELDHVCHTQDETCPGGRECQHRRCVRPDHLEPVTGYENWMRSSNIGAVAVRTNLCVRGHDLTVYGYVRKDGRGRNCTRCQLDGQRRRAAERRLAALNGGAA